MTAVQPQTVAAAAMAVSAAGLTEYEVYYDTAGLLTQLGLLPAEGN